MLALHAVLLGLTQAAAGMSQPAPRPEAAPTTYHITYSETAPRTVQVVAEFTVRDSMLQMYGYGAEHLPDRWRTFIRNERLQRTSGTPVRMERLPDRRWRIAAAPGERVRLTYDVAIEHDLQRWIPDAREAAYVREWGVFAVGRALFIYNDPNTTSIDVSFALPRRWQVATAWREVTPTRFRVDGWANAMQSVVFAGRFTRFDVVEGPVTVSYAIGGPGFDAARSLLSSVTKESLRSYTEMFGGAPASRLLVVINPDSTAMGGGGGVFRQSISMTFSAAPSAESMYSWGHTIAHEFFHIWNATALRRASDSEEWLIEGVADYYAILTMARLGYFPVPVALAKFGASFSAYNRVAGQLSLAQAGHQEWQEPGPTMLYRGGLTAALALDVAIRRQTSGRRSLDHVMRDLYSRFANTSNAVSNAEFLAATGRVGNTSFSDFFRRYVDGKERIPVTEYLAPLGLELDGNQVRRVSSPSSEQAAAYSAYFGPRARTDGIVPEAATRGPDGHNTIAPSDPTGRYEIVLHRPDGTTPLDVSIAGEAGKLAGIIAGPGGSVIADTVSATGSNLLVVFKAHNTPIRLEFAVVADSVDGRWTIGTNNGQMSGKKVKR